MQENWTYLNNVLLTLYEATVCSEGRCDNKSCDDRAKGKKVIND